MKSDFINIKAGRVHYLKWGSGEKVLIAFHGFGQRAKWFQALASKLGTGITLYALDLPFHGLTQWALPEFKPAHIQALIEKIREKEQTDKCWGLGYSLGGRLWLSLFPLISEHLHGLLLIAPDGIRTRGLGLAMALPDGLRQSLAQKMREPDAILQMAHWANKAGIINPRHYRFFKNHLGHQGRRDRIIRTWLSTRFFKLDEALIKKTCSLHSLTINILLGKEDPLIPERKLTRRLSRWPGTEIAYIDGGHVPKASQIISWLHQILQV